VCSGQSDGDRGPADRGAVSSLFTIAAVPGAGTTWYARLFTTDGSFCYHELSTILRPYPSNLAFGEWLAHRTDDHDFEQAQRRLVLEGFPDYFKRHWERFETGDAVVGNSDGFALAFLPALWLLWGEMKFVFSDRDGISVVQVQAAHPPSEPWLESSLRIRYQTSDAFELACHLWAADVATLLDHRSWLEEHRAPCLGTKLEMMRTDEEELRRVWDWLVGDWDVHRDRARALALTQPDEGAERVLSGPELWETWPKAQRKAFARICGETQLKLGYELPRA
jgi:hypothetical protein